MQPFRLVAAAKFLSCWFFSPSLLPSLIQPHSFTVSPVYLRELQVRWELSWDSSLALQIPGAGVNLGWSRMPSYIFALILPQTRQAKARACKPSVTSFPAAVTFLVKPCDFAAATNLLLSARSSALPPPASSLRLLHPVVRPSPSPTPQAHLAGLGEQTRSPHVPRLTGGRMCPLLHPRPWLFTSYLAK